MSVEARARVWNWIPCQSPRAPAPWLRNVTGAPAPPACSAPTALRPTRSAKAPTVQRTSTPGSIVRVVTPSGPSVPSTVTVPSRTYGEPARFQVVSVERVPAGTLVARAGATAASARTRRAARRGHEHDGRVTVGHPFCRSAGSVVSRLIKSDASVRPPLPGTRGRGRRAGLHAGRALSRIVKRRVLGDGGAARGRRAGRARAGEAARGGRGGEGRERRRGAGRAGEPVRNRGRTRAASCRASPPRS